MLTRQGCRRRAGARPGARPCRQAGCRPGRAGGDRLVQRRGRAIRGEVARNPPGRARACRPVRKPPQFHSSRRGWVRFFPDPQGGASLPAYAVISDVRTGGCAVSPRVRDGPFPCPCSPSFTMVPKYIINAKARRASAMAMFLERRRLRIPKPRIMQTIHNRDAPDDSQMTSSGCRRT